MSTKKAAALGAAKKTSKPVERRPIGRPSKYKPEYCERVVEMARETGAGPAEYAAEFDVDRASMYRWAEEHEEFRTALTRAKIQEQAWWERAGKTGLFADKFNALVWKTSVQARFRDDYTERTQTEISGRNGGPVKVEAKTIDTRNMSTEQREAFRQMLLAAKGE